MKKAITNFLSSRPNLTLFQCLLYLIIGYILGQYLSWIQLGMIYIILYLIQFLTRIKATADGMVMRQIMLDNDLVANDIVEMMKKEVMKTKKDHDIN